MNIKLATFRRDLETENTSPLRRGPRPIFGLVAALFGLFAIDALLFRTPFYPRILEPNSATGLVELILHKEQLHQQKDESLVLTMGDSQFAYAPRLANELTATTGYTFRHGGVSGSSPRILYYMLRDLDPDAHAYRAIVFGVNDYDYEDTWYEPSEDDRVLRYVAAQLRLSDTFDLARSFHTWPLRWEAVLTSVFKGLVYQKDLHAFLIHPLDRLSYARLAWDHYDEWSYNYTETDRNMTGLSVDWSTMTAIYPRWGVSDKEIHDEVQATLLRPALPQNGHLAEYSRLWFGRMIDRYRGSRTRIVFVRFPRGPVLRPARLKPRPVGSIREFASRPNVIIAEEHAFDSLEHPEFFKDAVHLNREGIARFSPMLAEEIYRLLGPPSN